MAKIKSLEKALKVLNCFLEKPSCSVVELSDRLSLNKSNVHDILSTFVEMDYIEQDPVTRRYHLGIQLLLLSRALSDRYSIIKISQPYMQEIADKTGLRVYLAIPHNYQVMYLESSYPAQYTNLMRFIMGELADMHCTGLGKAMLSRMEENELQAFLKRPLKKYTENTIVNVLQLKKELALTRKRGWAIDNMEHEFGVKCVALPIMQKTILYGAMSVSGSAESFKDENIEDWAILLQDKIKRIEERL